MTPLNQIDLGQHSRTGLYVASRASIPARGSMWREFRASGAVINSSWIDEDGPGESRDLSGLWIRIVEEIRRSAALILYVEPDDFPLKGAYVEIGIALAFDIPIRIFAPGVMLCGDNFRPFGSWIKHPLVTFHDSMEAAMFTLREKK